MNNWSVLPCIRSRRV